MKAKLIILANCLCCCTIANAQLYGPVKMINTVTTENISSREISWETSIRLNADTYISGSERAIVVKTWDQSKVKISTVINYKGKDELNDQQWFDRLGIAVVNKGNFIDIRSYYTDSKYYNPNKDKGREKGLFTGSQVIFDGAGNNIGNMSTKRVITIYIPKWSRLEINIVNSSFFIVDNIGKADATVRNGSFEAQNIDELGLHAISADFDGGNLGKADVHFESARFRARNIDSLTIESSGSTVIAGNVKRMTIASTQDDYDLDEAGRVSGTKSYKTFRIQKLNGNFTLKGMNSDIKIRNFASTVDLIHIDNKYADIRLSLDGLPVYYVYVLGPYNKIYAGLGKEQLNITRDDFSDQSGNNLDSLAAAATDQAIKRNLTLAQALPRLTHIKSTLDNTVIQVGKGHGPSVVIDCESSTIDLK